MGATSQQEEIIRHDPRKNGRVTAGPGTGKSWTSIELIKRLKDQEPDVRVAILTFTRAATGELLNKMDDADLGGVRPSTIHSFALSILMQNPQIDALEAPLRIPVGCEIGLIHADIAVLLRERGFKTVKVGTVKRLEEEMSARWDSLDPERILLSSLDPAIRDAYIGLWRMHRQKFGYSLFAELPYRAANTIGDYDIDLDGLQFLIVDEYQDLNAADISLIREISKKGVKVLAIGDDDQSIYSFRMAAPEGIRVFCQDFAPSEDYPLSVSMRCGAKILEPANSVIRQAANRPRKPSLTPKDGASPGQYAYIRFENDTAEAAGVAEIVAQRVRLGVPAKEIAILVRTRPATWAKLLIPALQVKGIKAVDVDAVRTALKKDEELQRGLALARLAIDQNDSLAWWTLFVLSPGISPRFRNWLRDATQPGERVGQAVFRLAPFDGAPPGSSRKLAAALVTSVLEQKEQFKLNETPSGETGWGGWLLDRLNGELLSDDAARLLDEAGRAILPEEGLGSFLNQLDPVTRDLALQGDCVRIMTMMGSKGLTVNTCITMGVEKGLVPFPNNNDPEEERRLLYVAMTRAKEMCVLTWAKRRMGETARSGIPNVYQARGRCPLFDASPFGNSQDGLAFIQLLKAAPAMAVLVGPPSGATSVPL